MRDEYTSKQQLTSRSLMRNEKWEVKWEMDLNFNGRVNGFL